MTWNTGDVITSAWLNSVDSDLAAIPPIAVADNYTGADIGAKINNALAAANTVYVVATGTITTNVNIGAGKAVIFGAGTWTLNGATISLIGQGATLRGTGHGATVLQNLINNVPTVTINPAALSANFFKYLVADLTLSRSVTALAGGDGIYHTSTSNLITYYADGDIYNVTAEDNYYNFNLGPASYSRMKNCFSNRAISDGVRIVNNTSFAGCQWYMDNVLSQMSGGHGFSITADATAPGNMSVGTMHRLLTFANDASGFYAFAPNSGKAIQALRMSDCFFGSDNGSAEMYLDTYGNNNIFSNMFVELGGRDVSGPSLSTPASSTTYGVHIVSGGTFSFTGGQSSYNSYSGFRSSGTDVILRITGANIQSNGQAAGAAGIRSGIYMGAGTLIASENTIGTETGVYTQDYGITVENDGHIVANNLLNTNTVLDWNPTISLTTTTFTGNKILTASNQAIISPNQILSGTYTPTLTAGANTGAATPFSCQYIRVGNVVTVTGRIDIDPVAAVQTICDISLPIASNLTATNELAGTAVSTIAQEAAPIYGEATNNRARIDYVATSTANHDMFFTFTYRVL